MRDVLPVADVPPADPAAVVPHIASVSAIVATAVGYLPVFVAIIPAIYYCILIWESKTVQDWLARRRARRAGKNLAAAQAAVIVAKDDLKSNPPN